MIGILIRFETLEECSRLNDDQFGRLVRACIRFARDGVEPELDVPEAYLWPGMRLKICQDLERYQEKCRQNAQNIRKRWEKHNDDTVVYGCIESNSDEYDTYQRQTQAQSKIQINQSSLARQDRQEPGPSGLAKAGGEASPSLDEIKAFCAEIGSSTDPERFYAVNQQRGWIVNGKPVNDWKQLFVSWTENERRKPDGTGRDNGGAIDSESARIRSINRAGLPDFRPGY